MKIIDYTIVFHEQRNIFLEIVRNKISKGYVPTGGISVLKNKYIQDDQTYFLNNKSHDDVVFYQAMVKYEDKKYNYEIPIQKYSVSYQEV
ncbi:MAG: hypothetical protein ACTHME_05080 [Candidatus Nitrosocosmicus sp.]